MARSTQPHRRTASRYQSTPLRAMQKGTGPLPHLQNARRQATKRKPKRKARARYSGPLERVLTARRRVWR